MFKINKLQQVENEKVDIHLVTLERNPFEDGKKASSESFKTLSFDISGDDYSFEFELNCKLEKLLEIPMNEALNFKDYIFDSETLLSIKGITYIEPNINIKIERYLKNKFTIFLTFYTDPSCDDKDYSGMIEFTFNLDDYLIQ